MRSSRPGSAIRGCKPLACCCRGRSKGRVGRARLKCARARSAVTAPLAQRHHRRRRRRHGQLRHAHLVDRRPPTRHVRRRHRRRDLRRPSHRRRHLTPGAPRTRSSEASSSPDPNEPSANVGHPHARARDSACRGAGARERCSVRSFGAFCGRSRDATAVIVWRGQRWSSSSSNSSSCRIGIPSRPTIGIDGLTKRDASTPSRISATRSMPHC